MANLLKLSVHYAKVTLPRYHIYYRPLIGMHINFFEVTSILFMFDDSFQHQQFHNVSSFNNMQMEKI